MIPGPSTSKARSQTTFRVWAPKLSQIEVVLTGDAPDALPMTKGQDGYWSASVPYVKPGTKYWYRLDGTALRPDPASQAQPGGVHGPSQIVDHRSFRWSDRAWKGLPLERLVVYELHVGTFTPEGTFDAIIPRLPILRREGITAIELMPIAPFPGNRNWGYDGAYPYAVQDSYGGPEGLKRLVNACHRTGLAVYLDVVYNHLGPEGNYLGLFAPYFTERYRTPWGLAINFDGPYSREVRTYFIQNALHWLREYHIDGLRLDAVHAIFDQSAIPFLRQLAEEVAVFRRRAGRHCHLIAESDLNDPRIIRPSERGGFGMDAQWSDDFHHAIHALMTGERTGYYADFGELQHVATALRDGFVYAGQYSRYRKRHHGDSVLDRSPSQLVIACQTHDQVGNRLNGDRLSSLVSFEALKVSRVLHLLAPYIPLFFMGEEYAENRPFHFFVSHTEPELLEAVRKGRKREFSRFQWGGDPPDPADPQTFVRSTLAWEDRDVGQHRAMLEFTKRLLTLRRTVPALRALTRASMAVRADQSRKLIIMTRRRRASRVSIICNFGAEARSVRALVPKGRWKVVLDSSDMLWGGSGSSMATTNGRKAHLRIGGSSAIVLLAN